MGLGSLFFLRVWNSHLNNLSLTHTHTQSKAERKRKCQVSQEERVIFISCAQWCPSPCTPSCHMALLTVCSLCVSFILSLVFCTYTFQWVFLVHVVILVWQCGISLYCVIIPQEVGSFFSLIKKLKASWQKWGFLVIWDGGLYYWSNVIVEGYNSLNILLIYTQLVCKDYTIL